PREYISAVEKGVREAMDGGVLAGYPLTDVTVKLYDGSYHEVDSSEMAFKVAGSMAFRKGAAKAKPALLEPVMAVEVVTPEDYMGDLIGDLNARRGKVQEMQKRGKAQVIKASVPLSEMFGYATDLRSKSQGRATYTMQFSQYEEVPKALSEALVAKVKKQLAKTETRPAGPAPTALARIAGQAATGYAQSAGLMKLDADDQIVEQMAAATQRAVSVRANIRQLRIILYDAARK
ncbi:hypothetical protein LCGC14_2271890, partial [marine sediment metagenome]